jgi:hypothetical protein
LVSAHDRLTKSGEKAPKTGLYLALYHYHMGMRWEIPVEADDVLPNCPECGTQIHWELTAEAGEGHSDIAQLIVGERASMPAASFEGSLSTRATAVR